MPHAQIDGSGDQVKCEQPYYGCLTGAVPKYFNRPKLAKVAATNIAIIPDLCCPILVRRQAK